MTNDLVETPLSGGRVTDGVVKVGNTVRKPATENSEFVHVLLSHLTSKEFGGSPDFLGIDEYGRDVLTFIDGDVPAELGNFSDSILREAASLIRQFHDLTCELVSSCEAIAAGIEVVCHNDLSPCNFVFQGDSPVAIIDFDASSPGSRSHDLGYAAWLWLDLGSPKTSVLDQKRRLATFLEAYGAPNTDLVLDAMLERQANLADEGRRIGDDSMAKWAMSCNDWTLQNLETLRDA